MGRGLAEIPEFKSNNMGKLKTVALL